MSPTDSRRRWRTWAALAAAALLLGGCNAVLTAFVVPGVVQAGREFVVVVVGSASGSNQTTGDFGGCVVQLPLGFTVVARGPGAADDPALLSRYTAEPGYYLASQSGFVNAMTASTQFIVRAPLATGAFTFKVSIAGYAGGSSYQAVDPPARYAFAQITAAPHVQQLSVQSSVTDQFALDPPLPATNERSLRLADIDRDGLDDLVAGLGPRVWLARPGNTWLDRSPPAAGSPLDGVAVGDFDGDGHLDLVHASRALYFGDGQGNWTASSLQPPTNGPVVALGSGDYDGDGRDDILEGDANGWLRCFHSLPGRSFRSLSYGLPGAGTVQSELDLADLDGDGFLDIVGSSGAWRGNGLGTWSAFSGLSIGAARRVIADLVGDSRPEIVAMSSSANAFAWILSTTNGTTWTSTSTPLGGATNRVYSGLALADLDGDGILEVLFAGVGIEVWHMQGGTWVPLAVTGLPPRLARSNAESPVVDRIVVGDLDGNGRPDLVATSGFAGDWAPLAWRSLMTGALAYGSACSAPGFATPALGAMGRPQVGNAAFALDLSGGQPASLGLLWLGLSMHRRGSQQLPLSLAALGAPGCSLLAEDLAVRLLLLDPTGAAASPLPVPNDLGLRYVSLFAQAAVLAPGANPLGALTSQGLAIRIE